MHESAHLQLHAVSEYRGDLARACRELGGRDPDDAHPLALALGLSLWTNDRDLVGHGVEWYPTARLLGERCP